MQPTNKPPSPLVQIEPLKKFSSTSEKPSDTSSPEIEIPTLTDWQVLQKKSYVTIRKISGFFYTKHSYGATRRWVLSKVLPDKILYRWKPYQRGGCNRCGLCCKIVFRCPFFYEEENTTACLIYTSPKHAPPSCVVFAIDRGDLAA